MNELMLRISLNIGFQFMFVKGVVDCMKRYHFCINIDECTFNNSQKIFSIHVSYFDIEIGESVVQHYKLVSSREGNVKSLLECICNCFIRDDIQNLELEQVLGIKAPQLLDIDGDIFVETCVKLKSIKES